MKKWMMAEIICVCSLWLGITAFSWFHAPQEISVSERRPLQQFPQPTAENILNVSFMTDFESYTLDQFPKRDTFRTLKAITAYNLFRQKDNNGIYIADGQAAKLEFPLNEASMENAAAKLMKIYNTFLSETDANIYFSIIPDKSYYLAEQNGYPAMDYEKMEQYFLAQLPFAQYIDIFSTLSGDDYYFTDSHWKQEALSGTAQMLASGMGISLQSVYEEVSVPAPFYGVYYGQAALPLQPDTITYLTNEMLDQCTVFNVENGKTTGIYNMEKLNSNDPYEMFLSGAAAILHLENPMAESKRELIVFRDSYGSSIVPLLAEAYSKITLIDTRYIAPDYLGQFVDFSAADDMLFLYSTTLLNNSSTLK